MTAEEIVLALAKREPPTDTEWDNCKLCWVDFGRRTGREDDPANHEPDCPWRLAREWVAAHPVAEPWTRHSLYRITDQTLITEYIVPPSRSIVWTPGLDFDPRYPEGYEWRVTEIPDQS